MIRKREYIQRKLSLYGSHNGTISPNLQLSFYDLYSRTRFLSSIVLRCSLPLSLLFTFPMFSPLLQIFTLHRIINIGTILQDMKNIAGCSIEK